AAVPPHRAPPARQACLGDRHPGHGAVDRRARYWRRMTGPGQPEQLALLLSLQRELALETDIDVVLRRSAEFAVALPDAARATAPGSACSSSSTRRAISRSRRTTRT